MGAPPAAASAPVVVHCQPGVDSAAQRAVVELLRAQLAEKRQEGVAVAAYRHGKLLVSAWAGAGVQRDTLFMAASVSKGVTAAALAVLHSRGLLDYTAPVCRYWPAFAANGKEDITVEQARATSDCARVCCA
jgi:CubicO group peptidase (beta-lactamase class C family)